MSENRFLLLQYVWFSQNGCLFVHRSDWKFILPISEANSISMLQIKCLQIKWVNEFIILFGSKDICQFGNCFDSLLHSKGNFSWIKNPTTFTRWIILYRALYQLLLCWYTDQHMWRIFDCLFDWNINGSSRIQGHETQKR